MTYETKQYGHSTIKRLCLIKEFQWTKHVDIVNQYLHGKYRTIPSQINAAKPEGHNIQPIVFSSLKGIALETTGSWLVIPYLEYASPFSTGISLRDLMRFGSPVPGKYTLGPYHLSSWALAVESGEQVTPKVAPNSICLVVAGGVPISLVATKRRFVIYLCLAISLIPVYKSRTWIKILWARSCGL